MLARAGANQTWLGAVDHPASGGSPRSDLLSRVLQHASASIQYALRRRPGCTRAELSMLVGHYVLMAMFWLGSRTERSARRSPWCTTC
jgi:hypothetical protein